MSIAASIKNSQVLNIGTKSLTPFLRFSYIEHVTYEDCSWSRCAAEFTSYSGSTVLQQPLRDAVLLIILRLHIVTIKLFILK